MTREIPSCKDPEEEHSREREQLREGSSGRNELGVFKEEKGSLLKQM